MCLNEFHIHFFHVAVIVVEKIDRSRYLRPTPCFVATHIAQSESVKSASRGL